MIKYDREGNEIKIGHVLLYASLGSLFKLQVLDITLKGLKVSCKYSLSNFKSYRTNEIISYAYVHRTFDLFEHNSWRYVQLNSSQCLIIGHKILDDTFVSNLKSKTKLLNEYKLNMNE